jgi:hypothetical protein
MTDKDWEHVGAWAMFEAAWHISQGKTVVTPEEVHGITGWLPGQGTARTWVDDNHEAYTGIVNGYLLNPDLVPFRIM